MEFISNWKSIYLASVCKNQFLHVGKVVALQIIIYLMFLVICFILHRMLFVRHSKKKKVKLKNQKKIIFAKNLK